MKSSSKLSSGIAVLSLVCLAIYLLLDFVLPGLSSWAPVPLYALLAVGGTLLVYDLLKRVAVFDFGADLLAGLSIITSVLLGEYLAGSLVVLMLSGGRTIEEYALRSASKMLEALSKRAPTEAHRKEGEKLKTISVGEIALNDVLVVLPHEICPVDGVVIEGHTVMDESYLTGEPFLISKAPGSEVISGAVNGEMSVTLRATKLAEDSRYAKIIKVLSETEQKRPHLRRLADQLGAWYTPFALIIAFLAWGLSGEAVRFLAVLVIATPCPLLIGIPVAIIGTISLAATRSILIKNPAVLEQIDLCKTMIFDKTGTLTYGRPTLTEVTLFSNFSAAEVLKLAASVERYSKHPLAGAILEKAAAEKLELPEADHIREPKGEGLQATVQGRSVIITSRKLLSNLGLEKEAALLPQGMGLECVVVIDQHLAAHFRFRDSPRADSKPFIQHLRPRHGITKLMIISGDRLEEVSYLAQSVGIEEVHASQSPEQKVQLVVEETKEAKTAYLGDGINDAPALLAATVGIAFGRGSDITAEAAGAVIMESSLETVDEFLHISRRMRKIALQSAVGGMLLSIVGMGAAAFGFLPPVLGALAQEAIDVLAILNSLRTLWKPTIMSDIPEK